MANVAGAVARSGSAQLCHIRSHGPTGSEGNYFPLIVDDLSERNLAPRCS